MSCNKNEVQWKPYPGDVRYLISSKGDVFSTIRDKKMEGDKYQGYSRVLLGGVHKKVHHLVLETFVGPRPEGYLARHLDGNPQNNKVKKLTWGTHKENYADAVRHGTMGPKLSDELVREIKVLSMLRFFSPGKVAVICGTTIDRVRNIFKNETYIEVEITEEALDRAIKKATEYTARVWREKGILG